MKSTGGSVKNTIGADSKNIAVICQQTKELYLTNPKLIQRLPKEQRAYWYWFLKHHHDTDDNISNTNTKH
jgi:hypothetical protein